MIENCKDCGICAQKCPTGAITGKRPVVKKPATPATPAAPKAAGAAEAVKKADTAGTKEAVSAEENSAKA